MSLVTANDVPVIGGTITMPNIGIWFADLEIDQTDGTGFDPGTAVTLAAVDGVDLAGVVMPDRGGSFVQAVHVRVQGGKGGMSKPATPRGYVQPGATFGDVLNGLMADAGETVSSTIDATLLSQNLTAWGVISTSVSQAVKALIDTVAPGAHWRFLPDGTFWVGIESWTEATPTFDLLESHPTDASFVLGASSPAIIPGYYIDTIGNVARVEHEIKSDLIRSHVWVDMAQIDRGIGAAIAQIVQQEIYPLDYFTLYDAKVISQSADLTTLDIQPSDMRLPGMQRVPLQHGLPGCSVKIAPGASIRLGWNGGDPRSPYVALWGGGETEIGRAHV